MRMFKSSVSSLLLLLILPAVCVADVKKQMLKFLDEVAASSNYSSAEIYQGQKPGYVT
jgi:hypothetical protein